MLVLVAPCLLEELETREDLTGSAHQGLQQGKLLRGQVDGLLAPPCLQGRSIQAKVSHLQNHRPFDRPAPCQRANPRDQLDERKRLHQVVVGTRVQPGDAVVDGVTGGQHQHARPHVLLAKSPADLEAIRARQHDVEHDDVVGRSRRPDHRVWAIAHDVHGDPFELQPLTENRGHLHIVVDDQHAHARSICPNMSAR